MDYKNYLILKNQHGKIRVSLPCVALVKNSHDTMIYLEVVSSAIQPVNAIKANIYKNRRTNSQTPTDVTIKLEDGTREVIRVVPKTVYHSQVKGQNYFMMDSGFNLMNYKYLIGGTESVPSPWFTKAAKSALSIPFLDEWTGELWQAAVQIHLIIKLDGFGVTAWHMSHDNQIWIKLMQRLRNEGGLLTPEERLKKNG